MPESGERVSNAWGTCPQGRNKHWKRCLKPDEASAHMRGQPNIHTLGMGSRPISWLAG